MPKTTGGAMKKIVVSAATVLLIAVSASVFSQDQARVSGTVKQWPGVAVSGVTVTLVNDRTGEKRTTHTNEAGAYEFTNLKDGVFTVTAALLGFRTSTASNLSVAPGAQVSWNFTLAVNPPASIMPFQIPPPGPRQRDVQITADTMTRDGAGVSHYRGNVEMKTDATILRADEVDFNTNTQQAEVRGNVTVKVLPISARVQPLARN
jgi:hypothetical protein